MKPVLAVIFVCLLSSAYALTDPKLKEKLLQTENDCLTKTVGLDESNVKSLDLVRLFKTLPNDGSFDKFAICILQRYSVLNADGTVNEDVDKFYLISDKPNKELAARKCIANTGSSNGETAQKILDCFLINGIQMIYPGRRTHLILRPVPRG